MSALTVRIFGWVAILSAAAILSPIGVTQTQSATALPAAKPRAMVMFSRPLPKLDGAQLQTTVLEVNYGPGESSMPHSHPCAVIGYVTQGAIRSRVRGQLEPFSKRVKASTKRPMLFTLFLPMQAVQSRRAFLQSLSAIMMLR